MHCVLFIFLIMFSIHQNTQRLALESNFCSSTTAIECDSHVLCGIIKILNLTLKAARFFYTLCTEYHTRTFKKSLRQFFFW